MVEREKDLVTSGYLWYDEDGGEADKNYKMRNAGDDNFGPIETTI